MVIRDLDDWGPMTKRHLQVPGFFGVFVGELVDWNWGLPQWHVDMWIRGKWWWSRGFRGTPLSDKATLMWFQTFFIFHNIKALVRVLVNEIVWLVVWNMTFIFHMGCHPSHWRSHIFQDGWNMLKPPTSTYPSFLGVQLCPTSVFRSWYSGIFVGGWT
jgi:hypothetical protein